MNDATARIMDMMKMEEQQQSTIDEQYRELDTRKSETEKMRLEITVMVTEKNSLKRELARVGNLYRKLQAEFREQREIYNALVDDAGKVRVQNSTYRGLIVENDQRMNETQMEIR